MLEYISSLQLSSRCTYNIGGPAQYFVELHSREELRNALVWAQERNLPWFVLGGGSNLLVSDDGFPGLVIKLGGDFRSITFDDTLCEVTVGAGYPLPKFALECANRGISGFECLADIPGTVGGAIRINAGTKSGEVKDYFKRAEVMTEGGEVLTLQKGGMCFAYRTSQLMQNRGIVLNATFSCGPQISSNVIKERISQLRTERRAKQPKNPRNCGSVFKAAEKAAGWYIEQCGLKGHCIGGAMIANEHANWIINTGNAKASDVKALIELTQSKVYSKFGIQLEREVEYVPEDILGEK